MNKQQIIQQIQQKKSFLCVGLDTDINKIPQHLLEMDDPVFEFNKEIIDSLTGNVGVGHVRYSTTGGSLPENAQPIAMNYIKGTLALVHNGNIQNADTGIACYAVSLLFNFVWSILFFNFELYLFSFFWLLILLGLIFQQPQKRSILYMTRQMVGLVPYRKKRK